MLSHPTHERLISLGLPGMAKAFEDQRRSSDIAALSFEERIGLMVDREAAERDSKRLSTRLEFAALRQNAVVEDVDLQRPRGIDRALFQRMFPPFKSHFSAVFDCGSMGCWSFGAKNVATNIHRVVLTSMAFIAFS